MMQSANGSDHPHEVRRVALVTGSSRGIGRATLLALAKDHDVIVHYRRRPEEAEAVAAEAQSLGARAITVKAELETPAELEQMILAATTEFGHIDTFVANAAAGAFLPVIHSKDYHVERTFSTIVTSFTDLVRFMLPHMPDGGRIVVVSGLDSRNGVVNHGLIGAAKAALESLVRNLAIELGDRQITVNAVAPGSVMTESLEFAHEKRLEGAPDPVLDSIPLGRYAAAEDIASVIRFLCSENAAYVSGVTIPVDGGLSAGGGPWAVLQRKSLDSVQA